MTLEDLGYTQQLDDFCKKKEWISFTVGRVISEHKERYIVQTAEESLDAEIIGNLRFTAQSRTDFPAVGDWVALSVFDENRGLIHKIFPRKSVIERQAVGKQGEKQIIASNIDFALIVQAVDRDFNINRMERYLTICYHAKVSPILILNKIDLINEKKLSDLMEKVKQRIDNVPLVSLSNESKIGLNAIQRLLERGKTYCLLGSSGVGKSTLMNNLLGIEYMKTSAISASTNKGRHVTSHREMHVLKTGGIIIDNPGMREVGIADSEQGLAQTFSGIVFAAQDCKYKDCTHTTEDHCAVLHLIEEGKLDVFTYENYIKMKKEKEHFESSIADRRQKDKAFGKMIKQFKKDRKNRKS